jgi:osmotically-inducible protein OsmY
LSGARESIMAQDQTYTGQTGTGYGETLGGEAQPEGERDGLMEKAKDLLGAGEANARPGEQKSYSRADERVRDDVCERLRDDPFLDASGIEVRVEGADVILGGSVSGSSDKRRAQDLAENVSGVGQVKNELRVQGAVSI